MNIHRASITVIVTVYKREQFLAKALRSVLKQSLLPEEIIVIDDSNSLAIKKICESFERPEIFYKPNKQRMGVAISVRDGIQQAKGQYLAMALPPINQTVLK